MNIKKTTLLASLASFAIYANISASEYDYDHNHNHNHDLYNLPNTTTTTTDVSQRLLITENRLNKIESDYAAANAALAAAVTIPGPSHHAGHNGHTSIGFGAGSYDSELGIALGIEHQEERFALKFFTGLSSADAVFGIGGSWTID